MRSTKTVPFVKPVSNLSDAKLSQERKFYGNMAVGGS